MKVLSDIIADAARCRGEWSDALFQNVLKDVSEIDRTWRRDWDQHAGEDIGCVLADKNVVLILFRRLPLALIQEAALASVLTVLPKPTIAYATFRNYEANEFTIHFEEASLHLGCPIYPLDGQHGISASRICFLSI